MKITLTELCEQEGLSEDEMIEQFGNDDVVPACCDQGCYVEPDGTCEHGGKSFILEMKLI